MDSQADGGRHRRGGIDNIFISLESSIASKDMLEFRKAFFDLENVCRQNIFEVNKELLKELDDKFNEFLINSGEVVRAHWPEVCEMMGGIEMLSDIIEELVISETPAEIVDDLLRSKDDLLKGKMEYKIIRRLIDATEGIRSGDLAIAVDTTPNSLTNRLLALEKRGLILRVKRAKNSFVYLTPKGKSIGKALLEREKKKELIESTLDNHPKPANKEEKYELDWYVGK
ncbi:MAG: hypothetical protein HQL00_00785 [Nitrospirae bacterium]|nr:hypothetical protein [Nitrospirota bacterium]